ncbi:MAG: hypothetical protein ACRCWS_01330 [Propionibacteriaceae bacterium]
MVYRIVGFWLSLTAPVPRDENGLSQSTENAVLLVGAASIAGGVILAVKKYVEGHMPA